MIIEIFVFFILFFTSIRLLKRKLNKPNYTGKLVWITGASRGLGQFLAYQFSQKGAKLVLSSRNQDQLNRVKNNCKNPQNVIVLPMDMTKFQQSRQKTQKFMQQLKQKGQKIDLIIQNAGISQLAYISQIPFEQYLHVMNINLNAIYNHLQPIVKSMMQNKNGQIVGITSISGKISNVFVGSYTTSKTAYIGLLDTLRTQLFPFNITVTNIYPARIQSQILQVIPQSENNQQFNLLLKIVQKMIKKGMNTKKFAKQAVKAIYNKQSQVHISNNHWYFPLMILIRTLLPDLYFWHDKRKFTNLKKQIKDKLKKNE